MKSKRLQATTTLPVRLARIVALAVIIAITIMNVVWAFQDWHLDDMDVYWTAAEMWRDTGNPYTLAPGTNDNTVYRYAPWFAGVFVPLTMLPRLAVDVLWSGILVVTSVAALAPFLSAAGRSALPLGMLMFGIMFGMAAGGNVHGLMIAWLVFGVERRSGPVWIALAASLKVVPLLYVLVYAGRGEWRKVGETIILTGVLVAPMLLFDRPALASQFGLSNSLWNIHPYLWYAAVPIALLVAIHVAFRRNWLAWPAIGAVCNLVLPRLFIYDVTFLLPGLAETVDERRASPR